MPKILRKIQHLKVLKVARSTAELRGIPHPQF
jgi:hypothetical protein